MGQFTTQALVPPPATLCGCGILWLLQLRSLQELPSHSPLSHMHPEPRQSLSTLQGGQSSSSLLFPEILCGPYIVVLIFWPLNIENPVNPHYFSQSLWLKHLSLQELSYLQ